MIYNRKPMEFDTRKDGFSVKHPKWYNPNAKVTAKDVILPDKYADTAVNHLRYAWDNFRSEYFQKNRDRAERNKAPYMVNLSGGIDSATAAAVAVEAVGPDNVIAFTYQHDNMNSAEKKDLEMSRIVANHLGLSNKNRHIIIDLSDEIKAHKKTLDKQLRINLQTTHQALLDAYTAEQMVRMRAGYLNNLVFHNKGGIVLALTPLPEVLAGNITAGAPLAMIGLGDDLLKCEVYKLGEEVGLPKEITQQEKRTGEFGTSVKEMFGVEQPFLDPLVHAYFTDNSSSGIERALALGHDPKWTESMMQRFVLTRNRWYGIGPISDIRDCWEKPREEHYNDLEKNDLERRLLSPGVMSPRQIWGEGKLAEELFKKREEYMGHLFN